MLDNYNALYIPQLTAIPNDYEKAMAVPVTIFQYPNINDFEIIGLTPLALGNKLRTKIYPTQIEYTESKSGKIKTQYVKKLNDVPAVLLDGKPKDYPFYQIDDKYYRALFPKVLVKYKE